MSLSLHLVELSQQHVETKVELTMIEESLFTRPLSLIVLNFV